MSGGLSANRFSRMLTKYETEQETLRSKCKQLQAQITAAKTTSDNAKQFIRMVRKFTVGLLAIVPTLNVIACIESRSDSYVAVTSVKA